MLTTIFSYIVSVITFTILTYIVRNFFDFNLKKFSLNILVGILLSSIDLLVKDTVSIKLFCIFTLCAISYYFLFKKDIKHSILDSLFISLTSLVYYIISTEILILLSVKTNIGIYVTSNFTFLSKILTCLFINIFSIFLFFSLKKVGDIDYIFDIVNYKVIIFAVTIVLFSLLYELNMLYIFSGKLSLKFNTLSHLIFMMSMCSIYVFTFFKKEKITREIDLLEMDNKNLESIVDGVKTLKHDFNNIFQTINGYLMIKKYDELDTYVKSIMEECHIINNFSLINKKIFNNPAIYGIVSSKNFVALENNIYFDMDVSVDFNAISFPINDFARILGILLDNAIEASLKTSSPYIRLEGKFNTLKNAYVFKIINSYDTREKIDTTKIFEKGYSSKKIKSGIGLWEVNKLIKRNKNSQIYASTNSNNFIQTIIIENI